MLPVTVAEYIDLVDETGRKTRANKRGAIPLEEPRALQKLGVSRDHWSQQVLGVSSGFWRVVGTVDDITTKAAEMKQAFLRGVGFARALSFLQTEYSGVFRRYGAWVCWGFSRAAGLLRLMRWLVSGLKG